MDEKKYSLNDIFGFLREATLILSRPITVVSEDEGKTVKTDMLLSEYIAMSMGNELTSPLSRMASGESTASKTDVIAAMTANHYDEVAFPNYEHFGIMMSRQKGGKRRTSKNRR
jgi:hypothetical protein